MLQKIFWHSELMKLYFYIFWLTCCAYKVIPYSKIMGKIFFLNHFYSFCFEISPFLSFHPSLLLTFLPSFLKGFVSFFEPRERVGSREREGECERDLVVPDSPLKWSLRPGLSQADASSLKFHLIFAHGKQRLTYYGHLYRFLWIGSRAAGAQISIPIWHVLWLCKLQLNLL